MQKILMSKGARKVVEVCAGVKKGEQVFIVTEPSMLTIAETIATASYAVGAEPTIGIITPRSSDGEEPPESIAAAMKKCDVFICVVNTSITHTRAVRAAAEGGARGIMMTQYREEMLIKGGIDADFEAIAPKCKAIAKKLEGAEEIKLTTIHGTNLTLSAKGRPGNAMVCMVSPGEFTPVPNVEANVSPIEGTAQGTIVVDASLPYIGIGVIKEPITAEVVDGMITSITGGEQAKMLSDNLAEKNDPNVYNIAEIAIAFNPNCRFIGSMLEDEGVYGSVHIGIGTNITLGGNIKAACHYDLIMMDATMVVDGDTILKDGEFCDF